VGEEIVVEDNFSKVWNFGKVIFSVFIVEQAKFFFIFVPNKLIWLLDVSKQDSKIRITQYYHTNKNFVWPLKRQILFQKCSR